MKIGFYLQRIDVSVASILYRGLYPAAQLSRAGHEVLVFDFELSASSMRTLDSLVVVKAMNQRAYSTVVQASVLKVPVILDICDDIFVPDYGKGDGSEAMYFRAMSALASSIVTTGPAMRDLLRKEISPTTNIIIIEDPIETLEENMLVNSTIPEWRKALARARAFYMFRTKVIGGILSMLRKPRRTLLRGVHLFARATHRHRKAVLRRAHRAAHLPAYVVHKLAVATHHPRGKLAKILRSATGDHSAGKASVGRGDARDGDRVEASQKTKP